MEYNWIDSEDCAWCARKGIKSEASEYGDGDYYACGCSHCGIEGPRGYRAKHDEPLNEEAVEKILSGDAPWPSEVAAIQMWNELQAMIAGRL
jgi:hypothetical protein